MGTGRQPAFVEATCYLTIEPVMATGTWSGNFDEQDRKLLEGARVTSMTKTRPERQVRAGSVVTKVRLRIDAAALLPLLPEAVIHIGAGQVELIEVEAADPGYPHDDGEIEP